MQPPVSYYNTGFGLGHGLGKPASVPLSSLLAAGSFGWTGGIDLKSPISAQPIPKHLRRDAVAEISVRVKNAETVEVSVDKFQFVVGSLEDEEQDLKGKFFTSLGKALRSTEPPEDDK